ncbi:hypothetical protein HPP92_010170 [Vanilla planifolia]|uniref:galactinol--sucrose galactosyltransferase n=1 Tax=Vanilla planifolia TaxID=51239 RepID=A0A835R3K5_VANPL|nr:hypothetical protein HPP92_010170 [Vanilla planifolia]
MTVTPRITVSDGNLVVHGRTILTGVPDNIILTPACGVGLVGGAFIGASSSDAKSIHVFPVGTLRGLRFMCCFRFKLWWMTQRMGTSGKDVPLETQFMLVESKDEDAGDGETIYTVFLPLLEGQFRSALQGNERDEIEVCLESGDKDVETKQGMNMVYLHAGNNPFQVINQAVKEVEKHLKTFRHREKKKMPYFLDWFGWCTWDAFYTDVTADGVIQGLQSLSRGRTPPRFLIIDDGWQQIGSEVKNMSNAVVQEGAQFASRLTGIKENFKFQRKNGKQHEESEQDSGLKVLVEEAKLLHKAKTVFVWHALAGYWGGIKPAAEGMEHYDTSLAYPVQSPGVLGNQPDIVMDSLSVHGLGLVPPKKAFSFFNELHAYLASCGVDGVKVDVQNIIETLGAGHGGRVSPSPGLPPGSRILHRPQLPRQRLHLLHVPQHRRALQRHTDRCNPRVRRLLPSRPCLPHNPHLLRRLQHTLPRRIYAARLGYVPPEYHAAARAVGGGPIYVSDKPGNHDFDLLRKLVLPDGSVLRAMLPGRPTRDSLFNDPARRRRQLAQGMECKQVLRRGRGVQLPGRWMVQSGEADPDSQ